MSAVRRFAANVDGRDFVVGDIHGCFDALRAELDDIAFDETKDRLFSVGDLVDRGPASEESIDWIGKPWFHAVRGNHEQMAIGVAAGKHDHMNYFSNGGAWFLGLPPERQKLYADAFEELPYAIEIETGMGRIGIVHAECCDESWDDFTWSLEHPESKTRLRNVTEIALWARSRIRDHDQTEIKGLRALFVGHTPVNKVCRLGNVVYVDTGAVFGKKAHRDAIRGEQRMNGLRFKVGEIAIIAINMGDVDCRIGDEVEVLEVGPIWSHGYEEWFDYVITDPRPNPDESGELYALDIELRKRDAPEEPASLTRCEEEEACTC